MKDWIPKNKKVRIAAIFAIGAFILYTVIFITVWLGVKRAEDFYQNSESEVAKNEKLVVVKNIVESNKESLQSIDTFFIGTGGEVLAIEQIEEVARDFGISFTIDSINEPKQEENEFIEKLQVDTKVSGPWSNIVSFLHRLERMPFGVLISDVNLSDEAEGGWAGSIKFDIFRFKQAGN